MRFFKRRNRSGTGLVWICLLTVVVFAYAMFQGGFVSWFLFYSVVCVLLFTIATALFPIGSLRVSRELNQDTFSSGAVMRVTVKVSRNSRFPLFFLSVNDCLPESLQTYAKEDGKEFRAGSRALFFPGFKREVRYTYTVEPMPRGEHRFGGIELKTGDIFGFLQKSGTVSAEQNILVYPRYERVGSWDSFEQHDEGSRRSRSHFHYDITSVASVRDYEPGDRLSWMDWKSTARMNKLVTKEFERPLNEDSIVCIDRHADHYGKNDEPFEQAVTTAASMVRYGIKRGSSVGFVSFGKEKTVIPLNGGNEQQWRIFYHLAKTKADGKGNYFPVLTQAFRRFPSKASVIYVTPVITEALLQLAESFARRKQRFDLFLVTDKRQPQADERQGLERLRQCGTRVYTVDSRGLNEALKAGVHYATS
ncbi:MAG TPA: DUF58 domain-containing protein [Bacillales bacterium]|nr:DUF58 domain-containing protein [Bacillales bacterium]